MIPGFPLIDRFDMKKVIGTARKVGYKGVELHIYPNQRSRDSFEKIKKDLRDFELVTAHYPLYSEEAKMLYSFSMLKRRIGIKLLSDELEFLSKFEPEFYIIHAGRAYSPMEDFILLKEECKKYGMKLSMENGMSHPGGDLDYVRKICNLLDVGMTLDIGHAFIAKQDVDDFSKIQDVVEHVHLHNVTTGDHQGLANGFISIPKVVEALKKIQYDRGIVMEIHNDPDFLEALVESKKILDILWKKF